VKDPGARNIVGAKVEQRRKALNLRQKDFLIRLQSAGMDINASGLSKLEGQFRFVTDMELKALALTLGVKVDWLLGIENETR
jgi:transcriptional regulator with XRE-family HTH domain